MTIYNPRLLNGDEAIGSMKEKEEAKSLLKQLADNKLVRGVAKHMGWNFGED
jgi:hypothetical protein